MPPTVTLTAKLDSIIGGAALGGYLRITLCGFGPIVPVIQGTGMLADAGIPQLLGPQVGTTPITTTLWGNDAITPQNTFYEIAVLDQDKNVIQVGMYQFTQGSTVDMSNAAQIVPPFGFYLPSLAMQVCAGAMPGTSFTAPGTPVTVFYNGIMLPANVARPTLSYTASGIAITLNFIAQSGDRIDALCIL